MMRKSLTAFSSQRKGRGFTLVELLVVIAIIGILASVVIVSLGGARKKARDAKREQDLRQINIAMELKYNDDGQYPLTTVDTPPQGRLTLSSIGSYLEPIPKDPGGGNRLNCNDTPNRGYPAFENSAQRQEYCIWACLERGGYFVASEKGTKILTKDPAGSTMENCGEY